MSQEERPTSTAEGHSESISPADVSESSAGWSRRSFLEISLASLPVVVVTTAGLRMAARPLARVSGPSRQSAGRISTSLSINGKPVQLTLDPRTSLLDALREDLKLAGTKKGCDHGQCGACTVLLDGRRVLSCLTLVAALPGRKVTTIEGLAANGRLHPVQAAFLEQDGFQCGYCTPGQIVSAVGLLSEGCPSEPAAIRECMSGNLCRCGAYPNIAAAVARARETAPA